MASKLVKLQDAAVATGNGTAVGVKGNSAGVFQVTGTFSGTVTFEGSVDGTNWVAIQVTKLVDGTSVTNTTVVGNFRWSSTGLTVLRARVSAWTSGSITVWFRGVTT
jgi:hypothetical protein